MIKSQMGFHLKVSFFPRGHGTLTSLNLAGNDLQAAGAKALGEALPHWCVVHVHVCTLCFCLDKQKQQRKVLRNTP